MNYRYLLERYKSGAKNRYTCPQCGHKKCFTRYVDAETGEYLDDDCGKCDHESSCGYHYTPKEFFKDHPSHHEWHRQQIKPRQEKPKPLCYVPDEMVERSHSRRSVFMRWLYDTVNDDEAVSRVFDAYRIGATRNGGVIFWQIDINLNVRSGKIMNYSNDGHRSGNPYWVHSLMQKEGLLSPNWQLSQCLFGEHLLAVSDEENVVYIVESEKTALLCATLFPDKLWLATGGCKMLTLEKLNVLQGHKVIVIPDSGKLKEWSDVMSKTHDLDYTMIDECEKMPPNTDIADMLLGEV